MRQRPHTKASTLIDLTPLLDVIFLLLFVVILYIADINETEKVTTGTRIAELESSIQELEATNEILDYQLLDQYALQGLYDEIQETYNSEDGVVAGKVRPIIIYCTYGNVDYTKRIIKVSFPSEKIETYEITDQNAAEGFERLKGLLFNYIQKYNDSVIVFKLDRSRLLDMDENRISKIIAELVDQYEYVY